ncbi:MAG: PaaI family thioesterase [Desulfuromonas sp.]|nr:MAG: PaaI family thioesterase [Desulfuromonas sp.]
MIVSANGSVDFDLQGESEWTPFDAPSLVGNSLRFVSGDPEGDRFRVRYYKDEGGSLVARAWFGPETEGPPGHAHGGAMAAVLDEVLGLAAWAAGHQVVVGTLSIQFRQLLPLLTVMQVESEIIKVEGRKITVHGRIVDAVGTVFAEADCLCINILKS